MEWYKRRKWEHAVWPQSYPVLKFSHSFIIWSYRLPFTTPDDRMTVGRNIKISPMRDWRSTPLEWLSSTRDLDLGSGHMAYRRASLIELYLHVKFHCRTSFVVDAPSAGTLQVHGHETQKVGQIVTRRPASADRTARAANFMRDLKAT